jgi:hypothetical protein
MALQDSVRLRPSKEDRPPPGQQRTPSDPSKWIFWILLGAILLGGLALRLWGIDHRLPAVYNPDERRYFVPDAVRYFSDGYRPSRMGGNPPAFAYLLHFVYRAIFGGREGVLRVWEDSPEALYLIGRIVSAMLAIATAWFLYIAGSRLFDRTAGVFAAGLMAFAFLPMFFSRQAVSDVPQLAPLGLSLVGAAMVLRLGSLTGYLIGGLGLGLAVATKYTAAIGLFPLMGAAAVHLLVRRDIRRAMTGIAIASGSGLISFIAAHPYALLDIGSFLTRAQGFAPGGEASPKIGITDRGIPYYALVLTWGLGWIPAAAALVGAGLLLKRDRRAAMVLVPAVPIFIVYMGLQPRYFGRYLLPAFPIVALLAAYTARSAIRSLQKQSPRFLPAAALALAAAMLGQSLVHGVHSNAVMGRQDTREIALKWMKRNVPTGERLMLEAISMSVRQGGPTDPYVGDADDSKETNWKTPNPLRLLNRKGVPLGNVVGGLRRMQGFRPELLDILEGRQICWIISGSNQWGRIFATPDRAPDAVAYYHELKRRAELRYQVTPYRPGRGPLPFSYDPRADFYPFDLERPGPEIRIYRLTGGTCRERAQT